MEKVDEVYEILDDLGLDEIEIKSIKSRNKLLTTTTANEISEIINFFGIKCNLDKDEIATLLINNPLVLSENPERFLALYEIYKKIGFRKEEYRDYIRNYNQAFSINPKYLTDSILTMMKNGKNIDEIKDTIINKPHKVL